MQIDHAAAPNVRMEMASARTNLGRAATYIGNAIRAAEPKHKEALEKFRLRLTELYADMLIWRDEHSK